LTPSGNPWLVALLPVAAHLGETIHIADPVDPLLLEGVHENFRVWRVWYPDWHHPKIVVPILPRSGSNASGRIGSFFSGGADSFFTALFHDTEPGYMPPIEELITIWGFDIPLNKPGEIEAARASLSAAAKKMGKAQIFCWTNIRGTRVNTWDWNKCACGTSLAAVALCLEKRYWRVHSPGSWGPTTQELSPNGMHVLTDQNYSTQTLRFIYDGTSFSRAKKLGFLAQSPVAMEHLRICWEGLNAINCSMCSKCTRSMIALAAYGGLEKCKTFDSTKLTPDRIRTMRARSEGDVFNFELLSETLPESCPPELRAALLACIEFNKRYYRRLHRFEKLEMMRFAGWLFGHYKRRFVLERKKQVNA
jgi:hypothetical protein